MKKVHMIGNAHLDPVWLWDYREGFAEIKATFSSALERMKEDQDFIFTSSSAAYYKWVEHNNPEMFKEIQKRVKEGRWRIEGGAWIQPDCNLPSGESFVRQFLLGQNYFEEKFGIRSTVAYNVDSFGHNIILPQIIKKSGMDYYVFMRPGPHEKMLPNHLFKFMSRDGSSVIAFRILYGYLSCADDIEFHVDRCFEQIDNNNSIMCFYGVGNHGGGPTKENLATIHRLQANSDNREIVFSTPIQFFEENKNLELPCVMDELQYHAIGCYSALSAVKNANKKAECNLFKAEAMASISNLIGDSVNYPKNELRQAWENVLFNQFHDILPGTSIRSAYEDTFNLYGEANAIMSRLLNNSIQRLTWDIDIKHIENSTPFVVLNLTQWQQEQPIEAEVPLKYGDWDLFDYKGNKIECQIIESESTIDRQVHPRGRICFTTSLPSFGYKAFYLKQSDIPKQNLSLPESFILENKFLKIEIDKSTGRILYMFDKQSKVQVFDDVGAGPVLMEDMSDTWSHGITNYCGKILDFEVEDIQIVDYGRVKHCIRVIYSYKNSKFILEYSLYNNMKHLNVKVKSYLSDQQALVKLEYPIYVNAPKVTADMSFGYIERDCSGKESFYHKFVDLEGVHKETQNAYGVSIATDGRYSYSADNNTLYITALRNTVYAHHEPYICDNMYKNCTDEGYNEFELIIYPHSNTWKKADTLAISHQLNIKPIVQMESYHKGNKGTEDTFININKNNIVVSALKQCEKNKDFIIRLAEYMGHDTEVAVDILDFKINLKFSPFEVKTIAFNLKDKIYREVDMLEEAYE